jgi:leucyl aminopeptidase
VGLENGKRLARDLGSGDPERMSPMNCASYIEQSFQGLPVKISIVSDLAEIESQYPLAYAVARASLHVARHHPRIVRIEYVPEGSIDETLLFSGKGIVYDTGGADIKTGGIMAGMHMDKGGASNIAGFLKTVAMLQPKGLRVWS